MKKIRFTKYSLILFLGAVVMFTACEDLDEGTKGSISSTSFYADEQSMNTGVLGIYSILHRRGWGVDILAAYTGADDLTTHSGGNKWVFLEGDQFNLTDGNQRTNGIWEGYYHVINACNSFIENANPADIDEAIINKYQANAYFVRALMYFRLTTIFGDIPMPLRVELAPDMEKTSTADIMTQVISDFRFAVEWAENGRDEDPAVTDGMVSKTAANAFLAKALMQLTGYPYNQTEHWAEVKTITGKIMTDGVYSLMNDYSANFEYDRQNNKEIIWAHQFYRNSWPVKTESRWYGAFWREWMDMFLEWNFYNNCSDGFRKNYCFSTEGDLSAQYNHPLLTKLLYGTETEKEDEFVHTWQSHNDMPGMRYSEVLLMYAEACANTGAAADGYEALNMVRRRAYAANSTTQEEVALLADDFWKTADPMVDYTTAEGDFVEAILTERLYEFTAEVGGNRWLDLVRHEKVGEANANRDSRELPLVGDPNDKGLWVAKIPGNEVLLNPNLAD